jgi:hypothetical protein
MILREVMVTQRSLLVILILAVDVSESSLSYRQFNGNWASWNLYFINMACYSVSITLWVHDTEPRQYIKLEMLNIVAHNIVLYC